MPLRSLIEERTERTIARGALYTALERLEGKGCLRSVMKDPSDERGGRATADLRRHAQGSRGPPRDARGAPAPLHRARNDPGTTVTPSPPRLAARLLAFAFADPEWRDSVLGDLQEEFSSACARFGPSRARWWYRRQAFGLTLHRLAAHLPGRSRMPQRLPEPAPDRAGMSGLLWYDLRQAWRSVRHHPALSATIMHRAGRGPRGKRDDLRAGRRDGAAAVPVSRSVAGRHDRVRRPHAYLQSNVRRAR